MLQLLLFCIALCASAYGALNGSLPSLFVATAATLVGAASLFGNPSRQHKTQQVIGAGFALHSWLMISVAAVLLASLAARRALDNPFDFNSGYLWLAGLFLVILAGYVHDYYWRRRITAIPPEQETLARAIRLDRFDWVLMATMTAVALYLRLYRLTDFLPTMHGDEGEMGMLALLARHGPAGGINPRPLPLFSTAFLDHPTLFHYLQAAALWFFGESLYGLRALSALFGALCVPVVYSIGRWGWGRIAAMTAGWLLAVSHFHLHYSRIALNNIESVWFLALFILLLLVAAAKTQEKPRHAAQPENAAAPLPLRYAPLTPYLWAGLAMGLSQYFYYGSRLIPVLAGPLLLLLWLKRRLSMSQVVMLAVATFVAYAPLAGHYSQSLPAFLNRTKGVSVISPEGLVHTLGPQAVWPDDIPQLVWEQVKRNLAFFANDGDRSSFYMADVGSFDPITIALFWLGLGVLLARPTRFAEFAILLWWGVGLTLAGVITNDAPNGPRLVVITTTVYVIGGIFLQHSFNLLWLRQVAFDSAYAFLVTPDLAGGGITTMADLAAAMNSQQTPLQFCVETGFTDRAEGEPSALFALYDMTLTLETFQTLPADTIYTALRDGDCTVAIALRTDGRVGAWGLTALQDPLHSLPAYVPGLVARRAIVEQYPELATALDGVSALLDNATITALNARLTLGADGEAATGDEEAVTAVAQAFLCENRLITGCTAAPTAVLPDDTPVATVTTTIPLPVPPVTIVNPITPVAVAATPPPAATTTIEVLTPDGYGVNARATANIAATVVTVLPRNTTVLAIGRTADNDWLQIRLPDNQVVWVFTAAVLTDPAVLTNLPVVTPPGF